jgi:hypothetical protein
VIVTVLFDERVSPKGVSRYQSPFSGSVAEPVKVAPDITKRPPLTVENKIPFPGDPLVFVVIVVVAPVDVAEMKFGERTLLLIALAMFSAVMVLVVPRVKSTPAVNVTDGPNKGAGDVSMVKVSPAMGSRTLIVPKAHFVSMIVPREYV